MQNERDSQVLALSEPRLRFHPEYETHVGMMFNWWRRSRPRLVVRSYPFQKEVRTPFSTASTSGESLFAHTSRSQVFRSEQLGSSSQYLRNPSVELLQKSTRAPLSCWRAFVFAPFPRTTSSVALRPLLIRVGIHLFPRQDIVQELTCFGSQGFILRLDILAKCRLGNRSTVCCSFK